MVARTSNVTPSVEPWKVAPASAEDFLKLGYTRTCVTRARAEGPRSSPTLQHVAPVTQLLAFMVVSMLPSVA
jgi:hypothetical protein